MGVAKQGCYKGMSWMLQGSCQLILSSLASGVTWQEAVTPAEKEESHSFCSDGA